MLAVLLVSGCTSASETASDTASDTTTDADQTEQVSPATPSPTPSPTASPAVRTLSPTSPIAGGCAALATAPGVADALGGIRHVEALADLWHVGIDTAGGLACSLRGSRAPVDVYIIPDALVRGDVATLAAEPACERDGFTGQCWAPVSANGHVTLVVGAVAASEDSATALTMLGGIADAISAAAAEGDPVRSQKTTWVKPLDCEKIADTIGLTSILGSDAARTALVRPAASDVDERLAAASSMTARCDWRRTPTAQGDKGANFSVIAVPNGAWAWRTVSANVPDSAEATVGGFPARVTSTGDVYVSDGVNLLHLQGARLSGISVADTAQGVLFVLATGSE